MTTTRPDRSPAQVVPRQEPLGPSEVMLGLRPATLEDLDWIVELRALVLREDLQRLGRYDALRVRRRMREGYAPEHTRIVLLDGEEIGCIAVRPDGDVRWLEHFYLAPHAQGRGIGARVLHTVLAPQDPRPVRLNVLRGSPARRLYERHGFVLESEDAVDVFMARRPAGTC